MNAAENAGTSPSIVTIPLTDPGEGLTEAEILEIKVAVGDRIEINAPVVEVETAKSAVELSSHVAGTVVAQNADPRAKLPPLAQAWLGLQLLALWWGVVVWFGVTSDALERGLDAAFGL